ncbi:hypothetical protein BpHYR1_038983 [Brachionus plicatilis]|uniref:Uncharacterized protein n=1 Tax=Brachionus plicatilis TaxID=10195 RepID=A0A3M7R7H2_BRAPC|nr:hypothetical protein BpHYR1_038983 [Brachionus plicatilis]
MQDYFSIIMTVKILIIESILSSYNQELASYHPKIYSMELLGVSIKIDVFIILKLKEIGQAQ